jgi:hypothetical protein
MIVQEVGNGGFVSSPDMRVADADDEASNTHVEPLIPPLQNSVQWYRDYRFPASEQCDGLREKTDTLPDMLVIPFEVSVRDMTLAGWEDLWVSKARYVGTHPTEPKIDFVHTCMSCSGLCYTNLTSF